MQAITYRREQIPVSHAAVLRQHESTRELEHSHLAKLHWLRVEQTKEQHGVENLNQQEYTKRMKQELLAQHSAEQKQIPKNVKVTNCSSSSGSRGRGRRVVIVVVVVVVLVVVAAAAVVSTALGQAETDS